MQQPACSAARWVTLACNASACGVGAHGLLPALRNVGKTACCDVPAAAASLGWLQRARGTRTYSPCSSACSRLRAAALLRSSVAAAGAAHGAL